MYTHTHWYIYKRLKRALMSKGCPQKKAVVSVARQHCSLDLCQKKCQLPIAYIRRLSRFVVYKRGSMEGPYVEPVAIDDNRLFRGSVQLKSSKTMCGLVLRVAVTPAPHSYYVTLIIPMSATTYLRVTQVLNPRGILVKWFYELRVLTSEGSFFTHLLE
jgi:hypothetical protein